MLMFYSWMKSLRRGYSACTRGTTAVEYGLIAGGIALAISAVVFTVGSDLKVLFQSIATMAAKF